MKGSRKTVFAIPLLVYLMRVKKSSVVSIEAIFIHHHHQQQQQQKPSSDDCGIFHPVFTSLDFATIFSFYITKSVLKCGTGKGWRR
jgi:hypothetical protein